MTYTYDYYGNRSRLAVTGDEAYSTTYTYDKNNRLTKENKLYSANSNREVTDYYYDPNGNMISKAKSAHTTSSRFITMSMLPATVKGSGVYEYNGFNQLVRANESGTISTYTYDADGLRQSKTVAGVTTNHIWDGTNIVAETNGSGAVTSVYTRGMQLISMKSGDDVSYYIHNGHGDVAALMDASGNITKEYTYDAFGVEENIDSTDTNPFRYCGEYYDKESGNIYLRARYYSPAQGRFTIEDPIRDGLNWYSYCSGNPVILVDPMGLYSIPLRETIESAGGTVTWNEETKVATAEVNDLSHEFFVGDNYGTYIVNGVMYVEDICVNSMIYAPRGIARVYYNNITDDFGKFVFTAWMVGDGSEQIVAGNSWNGFIKYNKYVKERLSWLVPEAIANNSEIDNCSDTNLSGGDGGYTSGYGLINGANMEVGGFLLKGSYTYLEDGDYYISITFQFNDVIDPNKKYFDDRFYAKGAQLLGYSCNDYTLRINGSFDFIYNVENGLNY